MGVKKNKTLVNATIETKNKKRKKEDFEWEVRVENIFISTVLYHCILKSKFYEFM